MADMALIGPPIGFKAWHTGLRDPLAKFAFALESAHLAVVVFTVPFGVLDFADLRCDNRWRTLAQAAHALFGGLFGVVRCWA